jgi:hypothetical protein
MVVLWVLTDVSEECISRIFTPPSRWKRHVPPKHAEVPGVKAHTTDFLTADRISNLKRNMIILDSIYNAHHTPYLPYDKQCLRNLVNSDLNLKVEQQLQSIGKTKIKTN